MQRSRSPQPSMSRETKVRRQHAVTHPRPCAELRQGYLCGKPRVGGLLTLTSTGRDGSGWWAVDSNVNWKWLLSLSSKWLPNQEPLHIVVQAMYGVTWLSHDSHMMITSLLSQMPPCPLTAMPRLSPWSFLRSFRRGQGRWFWPSITRGSSTTRCEDSTAQSTPTLTTRGKRDMQLSLSLR